MSRPLAASSLSSSQPKSGWARSMQLWRAFASRHGESDRYQRSRADIDHLVEGRRGWHLLVLALLTMLCAVVCVVATSHGAVSLPYDTLLRLLALKLGVGSPDALPAAAEAILWSIRIPRVVMALLVGAGLAMAGAALQGIFRNPLADPGLIGVSSGAALGAVFTIVGLGWLLPQGTTAVAPWLLPAVAFCGGGATTWVVYRLATRDGRTDVATLLLAGIAINAISGALLGVLIFLADDAQLRSVTLWMLGSLASPPSQLLLWVGVPIAVGATLLVRHAEALNAFLLGERQAGHLGVDVGATRRTVVVASSLMVGAAVAFTGIIGFVGLVVPHLLRLIVGPDHRLLLPASALLGAALLTFADLLARTIAAPMEVPIGILTSLVGGPFFLALLLRARR